MAHLISEVARPISSAQDFAVSVLLHLCLALQGG
jgi:hypothetical protein